MKSRLVSGVAPQFSFMEPTEELLTGWGRSSRSMARVFEPSSQAELLDVVHALRDERFLARGAGRSYGDTAMNGGGCVVRTTRMTTIHAFDEHTGDVVADPGVSFGQLLRAFAPRGWIPTVTPGTQFATIGGAIANDVHGKNHDRDGSFGDHLHWFDLVLPDGSVRRIDATSDPALFSATVGGIGLTGIIARASFQLKRVPSTRLLVGERRMSSLDAFLDALFDARTRSSYSVGWIDGVARGPRMGRGILETADHVEGPLRLTERRRIRMPCDLPARTINSATVGCFNRLYYRRVPRRGRTRLVDLERFFYPLDSILDWNRIYGRAGFAQLQCVIPDEESRRGVRSLLERVSASGRASFLAVIKTLGRSGRGCLSFPRPGVTLALDFPRSGDTTSLLHSLHDIALDHGGRVYLAKDSCLTAAHFRRMYPELPQLQAVLERIDPLRRMRSDMSARLDV